MQKEQLIQVKERRFVPRDFELSSFGSVEKFYIDLEERAIDTQEAFERWLEDWDELSAVLSEDMRWKYIRTSKDTSDELAQKVLQDFYLNTEPLLKPRENTLRKKFAASPWKNNLSQDYTNFKKAIEVDNKLFNEANIELAKELSLKENEYASISGAWSVVLDGEEITMQQAQKHLRSTDRTLRQKVFNLIAARQQEDKLKLDELLSDLVRLRHQFALNAGYDNFRDYSFDAMHRFDYTAADCESFHEAVASEIVPFLNVFNEERRKDLGVEKLKPWDLSVDSLNRNPLQPFQTTEEFIAKTVTCFNKLDAYFGACIENMQVADRLDLESRKAKAPGGYLMPMPESGIPLIFMNHASTEGDVRVMVHEGGHAIHSFLAYAIPSSSLRSTPSEVSELASMSMELFSLENWESFYPDKEDLNRAKKNHLEGLLKLLPSIAKGDAFQHWMYTNPNHSVEERHVKWKELGVKYGSSLVDYSDNEDLLLNSYQQILHFYQVPFYYIEYGFAQLGAIALWKNYKSNPEKTIQSYKKALSLGYTRTIPELYHAAGIQFDFSKEYVRSLALFVKGEMASL
ncbi:MAG: M3 family oligoendopeptidase [Chitinophagales bacterium]